MDFWLVLALVLLPSVTDGFVTVAPAPFSSRQIVRHHQSNSDRDSSNTVTQQQHQDIVICGGGPAGLLSAIMLAQQEPLESKTIHVYDRLAPPPLPDDDTVWGQTDKFYLIGLGGRGQAALKRFGVWDTAVLPRCVAVNGRKDWSPGNPPDGLETIFDNKAEKAVTTQVLPRDKLVGVLYQEIVQRYADRIMLHYGYEVQPLDFDYADGTQVLVRLVQCSQRVASLNFSAVKQATPEEALEVMCNINDNDTVVQVSTDLLLAADGTVRTVANALQTLDAQRWEQLNLLEQLFTSDKPFCIHRFPDDNQRIYKTLPFRIPADWRPDLNYSARDKDSRATLEALPANTKGEYCGVLLLKTDDPIATAQPDATELRVLLDDLFPQFSALLDDETLMTVAQKPVSYLPGFRFVGPRLHGGNRCILLGDCVHCVKPYFGLGANSALQDVSILCDVLQSHNFDFTVTAHAFSAQQAPEAKALVRLSRELDRPGVLGAFTFIIPLIMDSIFFKVLPQVFAPNVIRMLQREDYTFQQVAARKRLDRLGQVFVLGSILSIGGWTVQQVASMFGGLVAG